MARIWNTSMPAENALDLPEGNLIADFGFHVEVSFQPDEVLAAAQYLIEKKWKGTVASQAKVMVKAQEEGGLRTYAPLS